MDGDGERVVTAGADACVLQWVDSTEEEAEEAQALSEARVLKEQKFLNAMQKGRYIANATTTMDGPVSKVHPKLMSQE